MRLFVAIELNSKVIANLTELVRRLGPVAPVRWVHPQHMHVTLKYVGDFPAAKLDRLVQALTHVSIPAPLTVPLAGMGYFPDAENPRVIWAGCENTAGLRQLASNVDAALQPLGVAPEVRPYLPHLTLGRIVKDEPLDAMHDLIDDLPSREFGILNPDRFVLFESSMTTKGAVYRRIEEFPLMSAAAVDPLAAARPQYVGGF